ncbi:hypothetical protein LSH36_33g08030 [Paralvinella palmiformis]|uniref:SET domain-containing protein n=1 Tax=Paralvinella palmiformis TaxID=53620 RepID=A0AAD9NE47_9ANNE|nr:hypothetical protein LSH36_33g08030 [Paralvinella palmiformis]
MKPSTIPNANLGVFATTFIPKNTWLGEYEGDIVPSTLLEKDLLEYAWNGYTDDEVFHYIDGAHPERSNWLRFINSPNHYRDENISSHQCYGRVFYRTKKDLSLLVFHTERGERYHGDTSSSNHSTLPNAGLGVFATTFIAKNTWLGEYEGDIMPIADGEFSTLDYAWGVPTGTPYRAWRTLPWRYFVIKPTNLPYADVGVFATTFIPKNTWLGEYEGDILPSQLVVEDILEHAWSAYTDGKEFHRIDAASVERSNWLRFVNCPNHQSEENISSHFCFGRVFFRTNTDIYPGQELLVYYGDGFAEYLGVYDYYYST